MCGVVMAFLIDSTEVYNMNVSAGSILRLQEVDL